MIVPPIGTAPPTIPVLAPEMVTGILFAFSSFRNWQTWVSVKGKKTVVADPGPNDDSSCRYDSNLEWIADSDSTLNASTLDPFDLGSAAVTSINVETGNRFTVIYLNSTRAL
jgi:hypothetical protein